MNFKGDTKKEIAKAILRSLYGHHGDVTPSTLVKPEELQKRQKLIEKRRSLFYESKCLKTRKRAANLETQFFMFLAEIGWHTEVGLTMDIMSKCCTIIHSAAQVCAYVPMHVCMLLHFSNTSLTCTSNSAATHHHIQCRRQSLHAKCVVPFASRSCFHVGHFISEHRRERRHCTQKNRDHEKIQQ